MFLTFSFLHPIENSKQYTFHQAGLRLFFGLWCSCLIFKCSCVINNFRCYYYAKAFKIPLTILSNKFWLCLLKVLAKVTAMSLEYLLRFLQYFLIISFFSIYAYYVLPVLHVSYLYVYFVNISVASFWCLYC